MQIQINNSELAIRSNNGGLVSLTDLWKAMGSVREKAPNFWTNQDSTRQLIETASGILNATQDCIIKSAKGRHGGTWAHKNIALAYAKYLSPELHLAVNQAFLERIEEEANPELALQRGQDRATKAWQKLGKSDEWIEQRMQGVSTRKAFTSILAKHGVKQQGYRNCTNAIYTPLFGGTTEVIRTKKGLPDKSSVRDNLSDVELGAVKFAELLAKDQIQRGNLHGNGECELACTAASKHVANAIKANRTASIQP
jgi:hypothetical protein